MTKISSKTAYPKKKPISSDYFVGTDSEDFNKTVNFGFEEVAGLVNKLNGTPLLNYVFNASPYIDTEVLIEGRFLSLGSELNTPELTKLYVNKFNNSGDNLQELYLFLQTNATDFYLKLRNSNNQNNAVYFDISSIEDFPDYFILNITVFKENEFLPLLQNLNVYFFDFELKAIAAGASDPLKLDKGGYAGTAQDLNNSINNIAFPDQVLKIGEIVITGLNAFVSSGDFQWRLNQVDFLTAPAFSEDIDPTTEGFKRTDILEGDNAGIIHLKKGVESESASPEPSVTAGRIRLAGIPVFGSTIGTPSLPIVGDNYISKREKAAFQVYQSGEINNTVLDDFFYGYLNFRDAVTNLKSIGTYTNAHLYSGRELLIKNSQTTDITIYHLTGTGFQFSFPNEVNFILKPNEIIRFSTKILSPTSGILEYVGVVLTKADIGLSNVENTSDLNKPVSTAQQAALDLKLNTADYNQHYKGTFLTEAALNAAHPTGVAGDSAQVNEAGGTDVVNYSWDAEENIWVAGGGSGGATNTDALPEGSTNLYWTVARFLANLTYANVIAALGYTPSTAPNDAQKNSDITKAEIEAKLTGEITTHTHPAVGGGGDMVLASAQTVSGLKTFLSGMFGLRNVANTFTSFFTNANTAARTYTLQNRDGTLADLTDIAGVNSGKMNTPTGTVNYLSKFLTATTIGLSRLWDTGTFLGIGTANAPTKDITLGNQADREIGIEESGNTINGRDLKVSAGRTVNYVPNSNFNKFQVFNNSPKKFATASDGTIYMTLEGSGTSLYKKSSSDIIFTGVTTSVSYLNAVTVANNGNIYIMSGSTIYMQTGGVGSFVNTGYSVAAPLQMASATNGNIYIFTAAGIYMQTNGTGAFNLLQSGNFSGGAGRSNGDVFAISSGTIWKQTAGTGLFVNTTITSNGNQLTIAPNNNFYTVSSSGIYMQTNGTGAFNSFGVINNDWSGITFDLAGNIYTGGGWASDGWIYFQNNDVVGAANLDGGTLKQIAGTGKGTGKSRIEFFTGQKLAPGTNMQIETLREYIDENGYHVYTSMPVYADNAAAIAGGLPVGCEYRTATGVKMIVY